MTAYPQGRRGGFHEERSIRVPKRKKNSSDHFTCKYCERPIDVPAPSRSAAKEMLFQEHGWRNYGGEGWLCSECVRNYDMLVRLIWENPFIQMTHERLYAMAEESMHKNTPRYDERRDTTVEGKDDHFTLDDLYNLEEESPWINPPGQSG